jgi:hypothetical protein
MSRVLPALILLLALAPTVLAATFRAGYAQRDITPTDPIPMWGYGARHDLPATGTRDPLFAKVVVLETDRGKVALMGLDLGRGPTYAMTDRIQEAAKTVSGIDFVIMSGSHTHHGPVIELLDEEGYGKGKWDAAVKYAQWLEQQLIDAIHEAAGAVQDARIGWASAETDLNRNRHTKKQPKPTDPELAVIRVDDLAGKPIALLVNFAAHPTIADIFDRRWTSEWPGHMQMNVEKELGAPCLFLQGAAGDMSPNTNDTRRGIDGFGRAMAEKVIEINAGIETKVPGSSSVAGKHDTFSWKMRIDIENPLVRGTFKQMFFPEILAMAVEMPGSVISPRLITVLVNGELALVGGSGEFFCQHANRLKRDSKAAETFFVGYCNGHCMYFPTREAVAEGGYGADPAVSWVPEGAGEEMIDRALTNIDDLLKGL